MITEQNDESGKNSGKKTKGKKGKALS